MTDLAEKTCVPCRGGVEPLSPEQEKALLADVPEWTLPEVGKRLERRFTFKKFKDAFAFVSEAAVIAEAQGHHPDIAFGWGYATVSLTTHAIKGLHENDFVMAAKYDRLYEGRSVT